MGFKTFHMSYFKAGKRELKQTVTLKKVDPEEFSKEKVLKYLPETREAIKRYDAIVAEAGRDYDARAFIFMRDGINHIDIKVKTDG